jgi:hypothetical protein
MHNAGLGSFEMQNFLLSFVLQEVKHPKLSPPTSTSQTLPHKAPSSKTISLQCNMSISVSVKNRLKLAMQIDKKARVQAKKA